VAESADRQGKRPSSGRVCLLVPGMHRSGTSALSRVLTLLGADPPKALMPANEANEAGYWESIEIYKLNDDLLASAGSGWDDWRAIDPGWYASPKAGEFRARAQAALEAEFGDSSFFVLKDPRICRIAPFWLDVFDTAGIRPLILLPLRNPLEVAASLEKRDGFPPEFGHLLWLRHVLEAEAATRGRPRLHCSYDELMADWPRLAARAQAALALSWPRTPERAAPEIDAFLAESLRHHKEAPKRAAENPALSAWLRETFAILDRWAAGGEDPADLTALDRIRAAFDDAAPAFAHLIDAGREAARKAQGAEQALAEAQAAVQEALNRIEAEKAGRAQAEAGLRAALAENEAEKKRRSQAEAALAARSEEIAALTRLIREKELAARDRGAIEALLDPQDFRLLPAPLQLRRQMARLRRSGLFDAEWYSRAYPDVAASGMAPLRHYVRYGFREGRTPNATATGGPPSSGGLKMVSSLPAQADHIRRLTHYQTQVPASELTLHSFDRTRLKICWVIPDFTPGAGGHMTIFRIAHYLAKFGHEVSFLIQRPQHHRSGEEALQTINRHFQPFDGRVILLGEKLPALQGDALLATDRYTCYVARALSGFRRKFYFVQDYETAFYPMGSEALLTENTYRMGFDCLCAGDWLARLMRERYGSWSVSWPLAYDPDIYFPNDSVPRDESRIAFYARYVTPRRAVELGMIALQILHEQGLTFHVDFYGWDLGNLNVGYPYTNHGVLSSAELGDLYRKATLGVVFSATNHSLANREMMACGLPVVDFDTENVRAVFPEDAVQYVEPYPEAIARGIQQLLVDPLRREELRSGGLKHTRGLRWETSARIVEKALIERIERKP